MLKKGDPYAKKGGSLCMKKNEPYSDKGFSDQNSLIYLIYLRVTLSPFLKKGEV